MPSLPAVVIVKLCVPNGVPGSVVTGGVVTELPRPQPRLGNRDRARSEVIRNGRARRRRGIAKQNSIARAEAAPADHGPAPRPSWACCVGLARGAVVVMTIVVVPPPRSVVWLKPHVVSAPEGGVHPKLTLPLKPPTRPSSITA